MIFDLLISEQSEVLDTKRYWFIFVDDSSFEQMPRKVKLILALERVSDSLVIQQGKDIDNIVRQWNFDRVLNEEYFCIYRNPNPLLGDDKTFVFVLDADGDIIDRYTTYIHSN